MPVLDTTLFHRPILIHDDGSYINVKLIKIDSTYYKIILIDNDLVSRVIPQIILNNPYFLGNRESNFFNKGSINVDFMKTVWYKP